MESDPGRHDATPRQARFAGNAPAVLPVVLHVDDDPNDAELLKAACHAIDAPIILKTVPDGDSALDYLQGQGEYRDRNAFPLPSLILLDLKMPRRTGFEVLEWIRMQPALNRVRVLILTGSELKDDILRATLGGADGYLVKPLLFESLVNVVRSVMSTLSEGTKASDGR